MHGLYIVSFCIKVYVGWEGFNIKGVWFVHGCLYGIFFLGVLLDE